MSFALIKPFMTSAMYNAVWTFWFPVLSLIHFHSNRQANHGTNKLAVEVSLPCVILWVMQRVVILKWEKKNNTRLAAYHITASFENWNYEAFQWETNFVLLCKRNWSLRECIISSRNTKLTSGVQTKIKLAVQILFLVVLSVTPPHPPPAGYRV